MSDFSEDIESNIEPSVIKDTTIHFEQYIDEINNPSLNEYNSTYNYNYINESRVKLAFVFSIIGLFIFPFAIVAYFMICGIKNHMEKYHSSYRRISTIYYLSAFGMVFGSLEIIVLGVEILIHFK